MLGDRRSNLSIRGPAGGHGGKSAPEHDLLEQIDARIRALSAGQTAAPLAGPPESSLPALALVQSLNELIANFELLRDFSVSLASGRLDHVAPARLQILAPLKSLQANLKHLTWQTQEVAAGNLDQRVDFLGDFSIAFNRMTESLRQKERAEREALEASKLASIGRLAGGVAHEINTPLQYLGDNLAFLRETGIVDLPRHGTQARRDNRGRWRRRIRSDLHRAASVRSGHHWRQPRGVGVLSSSWARGLPRSDPHGIV